MLSRPAALSMVILALLSSLSFAQDLNYNTYQRGTRSAMMGGAAVAGAADASAVFYNPAGLAFATESGFDISAQALRWESTRFEDVLGRGKDGESDVIQLIPLLVARVIPVDDEGEFQLGAALSAVQQHRTALQEVIRNSRNVLPDDQFPGAEAFAGRLDSSRQANEYWVAFAGAWRPNERLSFGFGPIVSYRQQRVSNQFSASITSDPTQPVVATDDRVHEFFQFSLLFRSGVSWRPTDTLRFGLTATSPSQKIFGRGSALAEESLTNVLLLPDGSFGSLYGLSRQKGRDTNYRIPFNAELGVELDISEDWTVATSLQYWGRLQRRAVIDINGFDQFYRGVPFDASNSASRVLSIYDERQEVMNAALGIEHRFNEEYTGYFGFWTDISPIEGGEAKEAEALGQPLLTQTTLDMYNFITGFSHRSEHTIVTLGGTFGIGRGRRWGPGVDFFSDDPTRLFGAGEPRKTSVSSITAGIVFSYQYLF